MTEQETGMCEDFCLIHGYEHMTKSSIFDKIAYCDECLRERNRQWAADQARKHNAECEEEITRIHGRSR